MYNKLLSYFREQLIYEVKAMQFIEHTIDPIFDENSKILILGTIPSPKSREQKFFYGHPQNRFWRVLSHILHYPLPQNNDERRTLLINNHIALWDVLKSCYITGASDSSIKQPIANDISIITDKAEIQAIFTTGKKSFELYNKLIFPQSGIKAIYLPSPSPANCAVSFDELCEQYSQILPYLK